MLHFFFYMDLPIVSKGCVFERGKNGQKPSRALLLKWRTKSDRWLQTNILLLILNIILQNDLSLLYYLGAGITKYISMFNNSCDVNTSYRNYKHPLTFILE